MRAIDRFLGDEIKLFKIKVKVVDWLFLTIVSVFAVLLRASLFNIVSDDYSKDFVYWMKQCHEAGGFAYLGINPGIGTGSTFSHNILYQYIVVILHYIGGNIKDIYLLKSVSVIFDFVCAVTVLRITYHLTGDLKKAIISYAAVLLLPSVFLNSAAWSQNDSIYAAFLLLAFLHTLKTGHDNRVFIYFAISFCFKLQAIFFVPFLILLWIKNRIKIRYVFWIPVIYFISMIPALIAGRSLLSMVGLYGDQVVTFSEPTKNAPNIYVFFGEIFTKDIRLYIILAGMFATVILFGILAYYSYTKDYKITDEYMLTLAVFTVVLCFFCLPIMHERYSYFAEILAVVYGMYNYKRIPVCIVLQLSSLVTYTMYLFGSNVIEIWPLSIALLAMIFLIGNDLYQQMSIPSATAPSNDKPATKKAT